MGQLSRAEMEEVIKGGGSVLINDAAGVGQIHTSIDTLPSAVTLAVGSEEKELAADSALDAQIHTLLAQKRQLAEARETRAKRANAKGATNDDAGTRDDNENAVVAESDVSSGARDGESGALSPSGDRVGAQAEDGQNAVVRSEDAQDHDAEADVESETPAREADTSGASTETSPQSRTKRASTK